MRLAKDQNNFRAVNDLAIAHQSLGTLLEKAKRPDEALEEFTAAIADCERAIAKNPKALSPVQTAAWSAESAALILESLRPADAAALMQRSAERWAALADRDAAQFEPSVARTRGHLGRILLKSDRPGEAKAMLESSLALWSKLDSAKPLEADAARCRDEVKSLLATRTPAS
jgi:hypothetical protein